MEKYLIIKTKGNVDGTRTTRTTPSTRTGSPEASTSDKTLIVPVDNDYESSGSSIDSPDDDGRKRKCKKQLSSISTKRAPKQVQGLTSNVDETFSRPSMSARSLDECDSDKDGQSSKLKKQVFQTDDSFANSTDLSDFDHDKTEATLKKKKKSYAQKFKDEWRSQYSWLETRVQSGTITSFCKACQKTIFGGKSHLDRHENTSTHQSNYRKSENTVEFKTYLDRDNFQKAKNRDRLVKSAELKLTMFLHEHNLPFVLMDHLPKLISSACPDSEIAKSLKCGRTKSKTLTEGIAAEQIRRISQQLNDNVFSIIIDETTDIGTEKSLAMVARFFDGKQTTDTFIGLLKVTSCTAEVLFNAVTKHLDDLGIPIENLIGFAADNASVMMGNISGVQARFKKILPNIFVLGCVCHSFHLCSSAAAQKLPRSVEDLIRGIYNYFAHSSNRLEKLKEFQMFVDLKPHKLLHPSQTRWLSVQAAVDRVIENWDALILFFTNECYEDNLLTSQTILSQLKSPVFRIYFTFLSYVLDLVNRLNLEFQAEKPKLHLLLNRVRGLYRNILRNFIRKDRLDSMKLQKVKPSDPHYFIKLEDIYFGAKTELLMPNENLDSKEIHDFRTRALSFYVTLSEQIRKRFDFESPMLLFVSHFNPETVLRAEVSSLATEASKLFPHLVDDIEKLNTEWRLLPDLAELRAHKDDTFAEFWIKVFSMVNEHELNELKEPMFPNLTKLVKGILSLPHSSAAAERVFSQLNLMKTKTRNRLHVSTCDVILHSKQMLGKNVCHSWEPTLSLLQRKPHDTKT